MNWKIVFIGGIVYYVALFIVSMGAGHFIHSPEAGVLAETYRATASFWRPELSMDPPDKPRPKGCDPSCFRRRGRPRSRARRQWRG
jgi:hypothetical protein